jgi:hypothetical protein
MESGWPRDKYDMSKLVGNGLPDDLYKRLAGNNLQAYAGKAILICSVDADGLPHPAMLSYLEVVAKDELNIRFAAFTSGSTTNNIRRNGKLTMLILDARTAYYVKGTAKELATQMSNAPHNSKLNLRVHHVFADETNDAIEPAAYLLTGVTFKRATEPAQPKKLLAELLE